jgi:hypothetical protein
MRQLLFVCAILFFTFEFSYAGDLKGHIAVEKIEVIDDSATMYRHRNLIVTQSSGPVGKLGIPKLINKGDVIKVKDQNLQAKLIYAIIATKDLIHRGRILQKKGHTECLIVETVANLPYGDEWANRLWIHISDCKVLN